MLKFFTRKGSLRVLDRFIDQEAEVYKGDVGDLLLQLRQCPEYQMDMYHQHCGVRTRLLPVLTQVRPEAQLGLCLACWRRDKSKDSWLDNPSGGGWSARLGIPANGVTCDKQSLLKRMYTSEERDWSPW